MSERRLSRYSQSHRKLERHHQRRSRRSNEYLQDYFDDVAAGLDAYDEYYDEE